MTCRCETSKVYFLFSIGSNFSASAESACRYAFHVLPWYVSWTDEVWKVLPIINVARAHKWSKWYIVDATDVPLGRLSTVVASILRGKNKPTFTPHIDTGDNVIVINASKIALTGKKATDKIYYHHSNHPGGLKERQAGDLREKNPQHLIELSVQGMLPKGTLGHQQALKLHVFADANHNHEAQKPELLDINSLI